MEKTKAEKACQILSDREIDKCCEWLLSYKGNCIRDVPGVTFEEHSSGKFRVFSYEGKTYDLRYENLKHDTMPDGECLSSGDFFLYVDSHIVLHAIFFQDDDVYVTENSINLRCIKKAALGDWLEVIPPLVASAQKIAANKEQQEKNDRDQKRDENIDLGEYECPAEKDIWAELLADSPPVGGSAKKK